LISSSTGKVLLLLSSKEVEPKKRVENKGVVEWNKEVVDCNLFQIEGNLISVPSLQIQLGELKDIQVVELVVVVGTTFVVGL